MGELPSVEEAPIEDMKGMSGGPIFGFKHQEGKGLRYWLIAAQSSWHPSRRITIGCFVRELAGAIASSMEYVAKGLADDETGHGTE